MEGKNNNQDSPPGYRSIPRLIWLRFKRNKLAYVSLYLLIFLYLIVIFAEFVAPYGLAERNEQKRYQPFQKIRFLDHEGNFHFRPFVYGFDMERDMVTLKRDYTVNYNDKNPIYFLVEREDYYNILGIIRSNIKLFGIKEGTFHLFGTTDVGLDLFSLIIYGGRISLSIGLFGVLLAVVLGTLIGITSGYFGGIVDHFIQRSIEVMMSFPRIPLWMALSAALPPQWNPIQVYFGITVILSIIGWGSLARQLRGKVLSIREAEYCQAARAAGASASNIVFSHMIPNCASHIIIVATIRIPAMIIAETSLSFLGLGIRRPMVSWGSLLSQAQNISFVVMYPWYLIPALFVIISILLFNFVGDGIRDAADPYST